MNEKKILILGAGNGQIEAINYCKDKGIFVAGCSYTNTDKGIPLLDDFRQSDIKDIEAVAAYASDLKADAVYSVGSDLAIPTAMRVSEILGLPHFISYESAMLCHSKHLMRETLGNDFEGNVDFIVCDNLTEALRWTAFPAMMKPVDSQGQRGCFRVDSPDDILTHFETSFEYSVCGKVIIETFIDGPEISVNSYRYNGETVFAVVSDREVFEEYPGGLPKKHRIPSQFADNETRAAAEDIVDKAADKLGLTDGPCYCQMKIGSDGKPYILEIAPRLDGCHMWNLIKHWCGVDLLDACFTHLLTGDPGIEEIAEDQTEDDVDTEEAEETVAVEVETEEATAVEVEDEENQVETVDDADTVDTEEDSEETNGEMELEFLSEKTGAPFDPGKYDTSDAEYVCMYYDAGDTVSKVNGYYEKCGYMIRRTK